MLVINARNVNEALPIALMHLRERGVQRYSRVGNVVEYPETVATVYSRPEECVLFDPERDANPFFHFMEALWILGGDNKVKTLAYYLPRIADYSDDGEVFHGAYGYRLRYAFGMDQLREVVSLLDRDPDTRRAVVSIYDPRLDLGTDSKDIPCNDMIMFKIRDGLLHMTVCNRSNDAIWGAYGANAVQFSFIMQYVAVCLGVPLGTYTQVSDSLHVYEDNPYWIAHKDDEGIAVPHDLYARGEVEALPWSELVTSPNYFDEDLWMLRRYRSSHSHISMPNTFNPKFFTTVMDMDIALNYYRNDLLREARHAAEKIALPDWRHACVAWIQRRIDRRLEKELAHAAEAAQWGQP